MPDKPILHTSVSAALLMIAREILPELDWPSTDALLARLQAGRTQAYTMASRLREVLAELHGKPGRPPQPDGYSEDKLMPVARATLDYLMRHPGACSAHQERCHYSDGFRCFIVGLVEPGQLAEGFSLDELSQACNVPRGTLKEWLSGPPRKPAPRQNELVQLHQHEILSLYENWEGGFLSFCRFAREEHGLNYGPTYIGNLLEMTGERIRKKKEQQAVWSHETYRKLFPGAQWLGDGSTVKVQNISMQWGEEVYAFNLEMVLDVASGAVVGMAVSDFEDEAVLLDAFADAVGNTGSAPFALSLDNRASNHTEKVSEAIKEADSEILATTLGRGQSKAPLEGTFGLFNQDLPKLLITGDSLREQARSALKLIVQAWVRGRNGRPRKSLNGKSPADYYRSHQPTPAEIDEIKRWIGDLRRRQAKLRQTRQQRADRVKVEFLKQALAELGIEDPGDKLAIALSFYGRDAIVDGLATYQAKLEMGTLPANALPGPYLGGIIRNKNRQLEITLKSERSIEKRRTLNDLTLRYLCREADSLEKESDPALLWGQKLSRALHAPRALDYYFWSGLCAEHLARLDQPERLALYDRSTRYIAANFKADRNRQDSLIDRLARACYQ